MEDRKEVTPEVGESRRSLIKKVAYVVPVVLSLTAAASFARAASSCTNGGKPPDCTPV